MIKVCVCDDDEVFTVDLKKILMLYGSHEKKDIEVDICLNGIDMTEAIKQKKYDIVFLDIELGEIKGFDIGGMIRDEMDDEKTQIVYISSKTSYAMELFETRPLNFLVKPLKEKDVFEVMDTYCKLFGNNKTYLRYRWLKKDYAIAQNDIIYIQSVGRKLVVKTIDDDIEFYAKISEILPQLDLNKFCQVHKSFVINGIYVKRYTSDSIMMCEGTNIMISQSMKKYVKNWLVEYLSG